MKTAFESFVEPARSQSGMWRLVVGLGCIAVGFVIWIAVVFLGIVFLNVLDGMSLSTAPATTRSKKESADPTGLILRFVCIAGIWPFTWLVVTFLHRQHFSTLFSSTGALRIHDFFEGLLLAFAFWLAMTFPVVLIYGLPDRSALTLSSWTITLLPMIVAIALQAGAEELVFRGYILQQLAVRWRNPIVWAGMTSILFVLYHDTHGDILYIIWLLAYGLVSAALVWRTGSLLAPIGCHFGVNFFGLIVIGYEWDRFSESQLFVFQGSNMNVGLISQATAMILLLLFVVSPFFPERQSEERRIRPDTGEP